MDGGDITSDDRDRLVRGCLEGDEASQRELVARYAGLCRGVASRILGRDGRAYVEDAVQEALYAVFAKLAQWRGTNLSAWIGTVAARRAIDMRRRLHRRHAEQGGLDVEQVPAAAPRDGERREAELREAIDAVRGDLTDRQQRLLDGLLASRPRGQMADELGISVRTVHYELSEIRRRLEDVLESLADRGGRMRL